LIFFGLLLRLAGIRLWRLEKSPLPPGDLFRIKAFATAVFTQFGFT
jgi:hypothetical protein